MNKLSEAKPAEDMDQRKLAVAREVVAGCKLEQFISDSAFLQESSLTEFFKSVMNASRSPAAHTAQGLALETYDEMASIFFLEQFYEVAKANKDRLGPIWTLGSGDEDLNPVLARVSERRLVKGSLSSLGVSARRLVKGSLSSLSGCRAADGIPRAGTEAADSSHAGGEFGRRVNGLSRQATGVS